MSDGKPASVERMERLVGLILQVGVFASAILMLVGVGWHRVATGDFTFDYEIRGMNLFEFLADDVRRTLAGHVRPRLFVSFSIAVLLLTPYVRVLASVVSFALVERNWKYALFTAFVFSVLTYSLFLS